MTPPAVRPPERRRDHRPGGAGRASTPPKRRRRRSAGRPQADGAARRRPSRVTPSAAGTAGRPSDAAAGPAPPPATLPPAGGPRTIRTLTPAGQRQAAATAASAGPPTATACRAWAGPPPSPGGYRVATPPPQKQIKPPEKKEPPAPTGPRKIAEIPPELMKNREGQGPVNIEQIQRAINQQQQPAARVGGPRSLPEEILDEEEGGDKKKGAGAKRGPGGVPGRDARHTSRNLRQETAQVQGGNRRQAGGVGLLDDDGPRIRFKKKKVKVKGPTQPRKGKVPIELPITVRSLSEAIGKRSGELLFKLMAHGLPPTITINSLVEPDMAEMMAAEAGCELEIKRPQDAEGQLRRGGQEAGQPGRPPAAGADRDHHGPRRSRQNVAAGQDPQEQRRGHRGGRHHAGDPRLARGARRPADHLPRHARPRGLHQDARRGANVTDIAVIVVAADDGVMPQTEEAINHAKAAGVSIVVAINKVDLPNANIKKTEQQLYGMGLIPDTMGGDVPFVYTSAATGKGIDDLLDMLSVVAELRELKANPNKPAAGTCLEAKLSEEEGVYATLLVRDGTLRRGDVILVGAAYGRVRALYNDLGKPIEEAGPSVPVRITGLDEVPNADDPFLVVPDLAEARDIAENRKARNQAAALVPHKTMRLEDLAQAKVAELKVILKAEARGSIEAIRKELEKLQHEEVRVRILHAAIGGINVSDVRLALTSPEDTLILGFNVVPDDDARALAEERGIQIRQYNIIYNLTDDVRSALEGKLKPREDVIHLGRAVVRETFKISRVGTIAGCHVTQGVIERSAKVRVIRSGVVIYPPADRSAGLESLKRFKEDVQGGPRGLRVRPQGGRLRRHQGGRRDRGVPHRTGATHALLG